MNENTALELLKIATQLACATLNQDRINTATLRPGQGDGAVETVFKDCFKVVHDKFQFLTDRAD